MTIIANPLAGRGDGWDYLKQLKDLVEKKRCRLEVSVTQFPGHASELARTAVERGVERVIVLGGDGTISEVVNGVVGSDVTLGIISVGTGNDVARSLGLPVGNLARAWDAIEVGVTSKLDIGECDGRYFVSSFGVGLPVEAIKAMAGNKLIKGSPAFLLGVLKALWHMEPVRLRIEVDKAVVEKPCALVLVQNTAYVGGGLRVAPSATLEDGLLDVIVVEALGRLDLLRNLPKVYRGQHEKHPKFSAFKSEKVVISSPEKLRTMCDGELVGYTPARIKVYPRALRMIIGTWNGDQESS